MEKFTKIKSLGRGAQGSVILVKRNSDDSYFVIKRIFVEDQSEGEQNDAMNEIRVLSSLNHPGIVAYHGSFLEDGMLNVVMEHADNGSLFQHIQRAREPFQEVMIMNFFAQLAVSLRHLHRQKILHRDIKTKNIFVMHSMDLKLGDFGLSKMLDSQVSFAQSAVGTPYYLSPELCEGRRYNHKSDVWALGCVMYELCTFRHAFDATNLPALVLRIVQGQYQPIQSEYSNNLRTLVSLCLSKNPDERPSSEELCTHPFLKSWVDKVEAQYAAATAAAAKAAAAAGTLTALGTPPRPIFESGRITSTLQQMAAVKSRGTYNSSAPHPGQHPLHPPTFNDPPAPSSSSGSQTVPTTGWTAPEHLNGSGAANSTAEVLGGMGDEEEEFESLLSDMREALPIQDRIAHRVPHFRCFPGSEMVTYLVERFEFSGRSEATLVAQRWMDAGVFYHVTRAELFRDAPDALYRFKEDEVGAVLNMKSVFQGAQRPAHAVDRDFRSRLQAVMDRFTSDAGHLVDYEALGISDEFRELCLAGMELQRTVLTELGHREKIAFFANLFNAMVLHGYVTLGPPTNLHQRIHFFNHTCYTVGGLIYSLSDIEHGILRGNQKPFYSYRRLFQARDERLLNAILVWDPRVHCALVRGTRTCPALQVYHPETLEAQLDAAARSFCARYVEVRSAPGSMGVLRIPGSGGGSFGGIRTQIALPALLDVYRDDFGGSDVQILRWLAQYLPEARQREVLEAVRTDTATVTFRAFDWGLNKVVRSAPAPPPPRLVPATVLAPRRMDSFDGAAALGPPVPVVAAGMARPSRPTTQAGRAAAAAAAQAATDLGMLQVTGSGGSAPAAAGPASPTRRPPAGPGLA